jgi:hypothetical protein
VRAYLEASGLGPALAAALRGLLEAAMADRLALAAGRQAGAGGFRPTGWRPFNALRWLADALAAGAAGVDAAGAAEAASGGGGGIDGSAAWDSGCGAALDGALKEAAAVAAAAAALPGPA